ncbi:cupin domain-containing protein [Clostridium sp. MCC353]|uniref:cupin domain-containing protein n=1 Tax=Clostridium sp. MCC353 TaxID=2592646 RepID=UPI001C02A24D|nr:cupin domain-containing protein [Clostridium sp. MCC353]MBT9778059.1 cupin domain-containing protein [Clostridium sp. MCC353]
MVKRSEEIKTEELEGFKGGKGKVYLTKFITAEDIDGKGRFWAYCRLPKGCSLGYHKHTGEFETYYFLKGTGRASDNGNEVIVTTGDTLVCRDGCSHLLENIGSCDLEYIAVILNS